MIHFQLRPGSSESGLLKQKHQTVEPYFYNRKSNHTPQTLYQLTDEELLHAAKKMKAARLTTAVFIGFLAVIILFSVAKNTRGFFTHIPLLLIYKLVKQRNHDQQQLKRELQERDLAWGGRKQIHRELL